MLTRHEPKPGRQVTPVLEVGSIADRRDHRGCRLRSNSPDLGNLLTDVAGFEDCLDLPVESPDAIVDLEHESVQARNDLPHQPCELVIVCGEDLWNQPPRSCGRYRDSYPAIEQESAHLANQGGSMINQPLPRAMERLDVLLFERLLRHEPHVALLYGRADRLGIVGIVLLPAYERLHILRGHDLHPVPQLLELPLPIEGAGGGFDAD